MIQLGPVNTSTLKIPSDLSFGVVNIDTLTINAIIGGDILNDTTILDIQVGGRIITITIENDVLVSGQDFDDARQPIIDGLVSDGVEAFGWNAVKANIPVTNVVRTNSNTITITLPEL